MPRGVKKYWLKIVLKKLYLSAYTPLLLLATIGQIAESIFRLIKTIVVSALGISSFIKLFILNLKLRLFGRPIRIIKLSTSFSVITTVAIVAIIAHLVYQNLPTPTELIYRQIPASTKIYDRNGQLLYKIYKDENRTPVKLEQIPQHVRNATLAVEDAEFYTHPGFSVKGMVRSLIKNIREKKLTGGSTITQQLVKNTLLTPEKTIMRKLKEIALSIQVETTFSKDQILEMYLNEVSYGNSAYGIQEASRVYFGKNVNALSLGEAALLAGLPKSPTYYSPFGGDPKRSLARQKEVLHLMSTKGFITQDEAKKVENETLAFASKGIDIKAPHFIMYVKELLVEQYGEAMVEKGGLEVVTTLDLQIQELAESIVKAELDKLSKLHVTNGAALILHPQTGEILAMVGSKDYNDIKNDGNVNVILRPRSPGSSIKPIVYSYALEHGFTPATIIPDVPTSFKIPGQADYTPKNYDNNFRGRITLRSALAESRNVPAVKVLVSLGVDNVIKHANSMGIASWQNPARYGPSLTLGGGETTLFELAQAYSVIANFGSKVPLSPIKSIKNYKDRVIFDNECNEHSLQDCSIGQVIDSRVSYQLIDILKDNNARSPSFGSNSMLVIPNHPEVAVKTGTSNDLRDNLTVGFNKDFLVAVWVGNNDNSPMNRIASGVTGAAPIWNKILSALINSDKSVAWEAPSGLVQMPICTYTGTLSCTGCPTKNEWFLEENKPSSRCKTEDLANQNQNNL